MKGNIIITGFQGFIGIYTTAKFINEGYVVYGVDKGSVDKNKFNLLEYLVHDKNKLHENLKTFFNFLEFFFVLVFSWKHLIFFIE